MWLRRQFVAMLCTGAGLGVGLLFMPHDTAHGERNSQERTARAWYVNADGSGDAPTIQAALNVCNSGDTILVAAGTYTGTGNFNLDPLSKQVVMRSVAGPESTIIDCQGTYSLMRRGIKFAGGQDSTTVFEGFTIQGGTRSGGAAMRFDNSSPTVINCIIRNNGCTLGGGFVCGSGAGPRFIGCAFLDNDASNYGGGGYCEAGSAPRFVDCRFVGNSTSQNGAGLFAIGCTLFLERCVFSLNDGGFGSGLYAENSTTEIHFCVFDQNYAYSPGGAVFLATAKSTLFENCTFFDNNAGPGGGGIAVQGASAGIQLYCCLLAFNHGAGAVTCDVPAPGLTVSCCDAFGNTGGDWTGCLADWAGVNGNLSQDPLFCATGTADSDFRIRFDSPCAPRNSPCAALIGAHGVGCGCACPRVGDVTDDGIVNPVDVIYLISYAFHGGPMPPKDASCPSPNRADVNCDQLVNLSDMVRLVNYVYRYPGQGLCDACESM